MVHVIRTFTVSRSAPVVLAYLADFAHAEEWDPGTQSCTRIDAGPVAVGARWHNTSKILGVETELEYELKEMGADHLVLNGENKTASAIDHITVVPHAEGSEVTYDATVELHGLAKVGAPVLQLEFEKLGNQTVEGIQQAVDRLPVA